jgi:hypothetical protein
MVRNGNQNILPTRAGPHPDPSPHPVIANLGVSNSRPEDSLSMYRNHFNANS